MTPAEADASLRFKAQAQLPSEAPSLTTRVIHHQGRLLGLVLVDHLTSPRPDITQLALGIPIKLPSRWPGNCLLAIETPEGWEVHRYEAHVLRGSYPPSLGQSPLIDRVRKQFPNDVALWMSIPGSSPREMPPMGPQGFQHAPDWPSGTPWGIPLVETQRRTWERAIPVIVCATALAFFAGAAWNQVQVRQIRNNHWSTWVKDQYTQASSRPGFPEQRTRQATTEDLEGLFDALAKAWPEGVQISRFEMTEGRVSLTARSQSALGAVAALSKQPGWKKVQVVQIRTAKGKDEFDIEAEWAHD